MGEQEEKRKGMRDEEADWKRGRVKEGTRGRERL